ncbi:MAG: hypothetical protein JSV61_16205 [Anaerolineales bacterium]|nr:MAG: hypothetical protein JSV61_16205 [Anaerolineales bacterium]
MTEIPLAQLLEMSAARHSHLCPRQVLGVRMGLAGGAALSLAVPRQDKRLMAILETDGCFADGVEVASGCTLGHRTLRVEDYGKVAATFVDVTNESAVRISPRPEIRQQAFMYTEDEERRYFAQLHAYQVMPTNELLVFQPVRLSKRVAQIVSRPGVRVNCTECGEEIINEREIQRGEMILCQGCAGLAYYRVSGESLKFPIWLAKQPVKKP